MPTTCVFDAYGTLFDVAGAARLAAEEARGTPDGDALSEHWPTLAAHWRSKQLEYTWLRAITAHHVDFAQVTADGLDWAMDAVGLAGGALRARLLALYDTLPAYPEVPAMLKALRAAGHSTAILSNGSPAMLKAATESAGIADLLDAVLSVEEVSPPIFKPSAKVYDLVCARFDCAPRDVLFVSSNGWDVCSAAAYGFRTAWVNRLGLPMDRLAAMPDTVLDDLTTIPEGAA